MMSAEQNDFGSLFEPQQKHSLIFCLPFCFFFTLELDIVEAVTQWRR